MGVLILDGGGVADAGTGVVGMSHTIYSISVSSEFKCWLLSPK